MAVLILYPDTPHERICTLDRPLTRIGRAEDNHIVIEDETVSSYHAMLEKRGETFYVVDNHSTNGTEVAGREIQSYALAHGDLISFGDVVSRLEIHPTPAIDHAPVIVSAPATPQEASLVRAEQHMPSALGPARDYIPPTQPYGQAGPGLLPTLAFLGAMTIIGWPAGLVLGLMALQAIRRKGGTHRDVSLSRWAIGLSLLWGLLTIALVGGWIYHKGEAKRKIAVNRTIDDNEKATIQALKSLAGAQKYVHTIESSDKDQDGQADYLSLSELKEAGSLYLPSSWADGKSDGYRLDLIDVSEQKFLAVAEPIHFGKTGRRIFAIDQSGQVRGVDSQGQSYNQLDSIIPILNGERSAFFEVDDEIARDVMNYIKELSDAPEDQAKIERIRERLKSRFALTDVVQELTGISASNDRFMSEQRAHDLFALAQKEIASKQLDVALSYLNEISTNFTGFTRIAKVLRERDRILAINEEQKEDQAAVLFAQAEALERAGKEHEAQVIYRQIELQYPNTDQAERIYDLKPELQLQIREKNSETLFFELMELSPESNFDEILSLSGQLRRNYDDTDLYTRQRDKIEAQEQKARAKKWRITTREDMEAGRHRSALARLEAAKSENPELMYDLKDILIQLYETVGHQRIKESDPREALRLFTEYHKLAQGTKTKSTITPELMAKLHNEIGQSDFDRGHYERARWHLSNAQFTFPDDPQLLTKLGIANLYLGQYDNSVKALSHAISLDAGLDQARIYRAYLNLRYILFYEQHLAKIFTAPAPSLGETAEAASKNETENRELKLEEYDSLFDDEASDSAFRPSSRSRQLSLPDYDHLSDADVPNPKDQDAKLSYSYAESSAILPKLIMLIRSLQDAKTNFAKEINDAKGSGHGAVDDVKVQQYIRITEYRNQLSELRILTREDARARNSIAELISSLLQRINLVQEDLQYTGDHNQLLRPFLGNLMPAVERKKTHFVTGLSRIEKGLVKEVELQKKAFKFAEDLLGQIQIRTRAGNIMPLLKDLIFRSGDREDFDLGILSLKQSLEVQVNVEDVLTAARGEYQKTDEFFTDF